MIFQVLGCSGSESPQNHPCSFLVDSTILVDIGSAASRLAIPEQAKISDILISHAHLDHVKDLAFFAENVFKLIKKPVNVWGTKDTIGKVSRHILNNEIWPDFTKLPNDENPILRYQTFEERKPFRVGPLEVFAIPVNHPGGCAALFLKSPKSVLLYGGDTGPTEELWDEVNRRGEDMSAILLECSFPNHLRSLAEVSGHHTPDSFQTEIKKIRSKQVPIYTYNHKAAYRSDTIRELDRIEDTRLRFLEPGIKIRF